MIFHLRNYNKNYKKVRLYFGVHGRAFPVVNVPGTATKPGFTVWIRNNTEIMVILNEYEDSFECRDITAGEYCRLEKVMR